MAVVAELRAPGIVTAASRTWASRWLTVLLWIVAIAIVVGGALRQMHAAHSGGDIYYFYARAKDLLAGRDPYTFSVAHPYDTRTGDFADIYLYSPAFYLLLSPLTLLKPLTAWTLWSMVDGCCLLLGPVCFVKAISPRLSTRVGLAIAVALSFTAMARFELYYGNADVVLLLLLAAAFLATRRGRGVVAGVLLGLSAIVYLQALPFLLFYLWKREYRTAMTGALTFVVVSSGAFLLANASTFASFRAMVQFFVQVWASSYVNQSLYSVALRLFTPMPYSARPLVHLPWLPPLVWLASVAGALVVAGRTIPRRRLATTPATRAGLEFALALCALIVFFPVLESNTLIIAGLLLAAVAIPVVAQMHRQNWRWLCAGLVLVYALTCLNMTVWGYNRLGAFRGLHGGRLVTATLTGVPYLYLAALMCLLVLAALWLHERDERAAFGVEAADIDAHGQVAADEAKMTSADPTPIAPLALG